MIDPGGPPQVVASSRAIATATALSLAAAAVILVVAVLPAEYGIDPIGTGRLLGLVRTPDETTQPQAAPAGAPLAPTNVGPIGYYPDVFATDTATFELGPYDYVEYKYRLERGASLVFAWDAPIVVPHDLHGDPDGGDDHDEVSVDKTPRASGAGTYTAAFPGLHGWFWENPGAEPITITIRTSGFYTAATEFRPNRRRVEHPIKKAGG